VAGRLVLTAWALCTLLIIWHIGPGPLGDPAGDPAGYAELPAA
jgi:hypothetical protein